MRRCCPTALLIVLIAVLPLAAAETAEFQAILERSYPADRPGAAAIVTRGEDVLFRGTSGMADLELGVPLEADMVFRLGSITKQFTAAAIMMLVEQEKLAVSDTLDKFLPEYPGGDKVTVEHLLTHTSGIVSYTGIPGYMQTKVAKDVTVDELIDVFKDLPVEFQSGEKFAYNNSGYILLGAVIEKASGQTYQEFVAEKIFQPLGMTQSYYGDHARIIPRRARGYDGGPDDIVNSKYLSMTQPYAAGSLLSTVDDLAIWNRALFGGKLVSKASVARMTAPFALNDGEQSDYAYGLARADLRGRPVISHGGGIFGFSTQGLYLPEEDVYVAVLSNHTGGVSPNMVATQLAALAIGKPFPERKAIKLEPELLQRYVGVYRIDDETERVVTLEDGELQTQRTGGSRARVQPFSETGFFYDNSLTHLEFDVDPEGTVTGMRMYQNGAETAEPADKISDEVPEAVAVEVPREILERYVGEYEVQPGFSIVITLEDDGLHAQATGQQKFPIFASSETEFYLTVVDAQLTFVSGETGSVDSIVLHQGGRDVPAKRKTD